MKVDMSPKAIENRLKLVGELTKACLLLHPKRTQKVQTNASKNSDLSAKDVLKRRTSGVK